MNLQLSLFMLSFVLITSARRNVFLDAFLTPVDLMDSRQKHYSKSNHDAALMLSKFEAMDLLISAENATNVTITCAKALKQLAADLIDKKYYALESKANSDDFFRWLLFAETRSLFILMRVCSCAFYVVGFVYFLFLKTTLKASSSDHVFHLAQNF